MCMVGPTLAMLHSPTYRVKVRKVISYLSPSKLELCVCVCEAMQSEREGVARREGFRFQKPLSSVYWPATSFQKVLREATMQDRGC